MSIEAAFTHFPTLSTSRLHLRQIRPADVDALFAIKGDPEVTRHYAQEPHQSRDDTRGWMERLHSVYERRQALFWCIALKGEDSPIGSCTFWNFASDFDHAEIGYELHPAYRHQGIMSEALSAVLEYGFKTLQLRRVEACTLVDNIASCSLLRKLGFGHEATLRQREFFRGQYADQMVFGLLESEWRAGRQPRN